MNLLDEWKERLQLQNWAIYLKENCIPNEMSMADAWGCTSIDEVNKAARIEIVNPACVSERILPFDFEKVLVHELLHIKLELLMKDGSDLHYNYAHQILDELAVALVNAKRSKENE